MMVAGLEGIKGVRYRVLLLVGFAGAFRRSELVSFTLADIEQAKQGLIIQLLRPKTNQEGRGRKIAIPYARGAVCAVLAVQDRIKATGITEGPISGA